MSLDQDAGHAALAVALGPYAVDLRVEQVDGPEGRHALTTAEAALLRALLRATGQPVHRDALVGEVLGSAGSARRIDGLVTRLRRRLGGTAYLRTVRGVGYALHVPPAPASATEASLPGSTGSFVDRVAHRARLDRAFVGVGPVTLVGPGGGGKTRLAIEHTRRTAARWAGGVMWCELAPCRGPDDVEGALAEALDASGDLGAALAHRGRTLLVLDNAEHVVSRVARFVEQLQLDAPEARFLITSRVPLEVAGEQLLPVGRLDPSEARILFRDRAYAARGVPLEETDEELDPLISLLDGLPLALELAAARTRVWSVAELASHLRGRLDRLRDPAPATPHHSSLVAAIGWSVDLLDDARRAALASLSVCRAPVPRPAADAVVGGEGARGHVDALVKHHLIELRPASGRGTRPRVLMTEAVREVASLLATDAARTRHARWYADLEEARERVDLGLEEPDLRAAAAWSLERATAGDAAASRDVTRVLGTLTSLHLRQGRSEVTIQMIETALEVIDRCGEPLLEGKLRGSLGLLRARQGHGVEALEHYRVALSRYREVDDRTQQGVVLANMGTLLTRQGRTKRACAHYEQSIEIFRAEGRRLQEGQALINLAGAYYNLGELDRAVALGEASLVIYGELGSRAAEGHALGTLGVILMGLGDLPRARERFERALVIHREVGDKGSEGHVLGNLGNLHRAEGRGDEGMACFEQSLAIHQEFGTRAQEGVMLGTLGTVLLQEGRVDEARGHLHAALVVHRDLGARALEGRVLGELGALVGDTPGGEDEARALFETAEGVLREIDASLELASLLCSRARFEHTVGQSEVAADAVGEAQRLVHETGSGPDSELGLQVAETQAFLGL
jgi:predicted ATPase/Tfp pilus assembly protein PilF/DNA-binding winged helix-turn-helix (wHTH) protein